MIECLDYDLLQYVEGSSKLTSTWLNIFLSAIPYTSRTCSTHFAMQFKERSWTPIPTSCWQMNGDFACWEYWQGTRYQTRGLNMGGEVKNDPRESKMGRTNLGYATCLRTWSQAQWCKVVWQIEAEELSEKKSRT